MRDGGTFSVLGLTAAVVAVELLYFEREGIEDAIESVERRV